MTATRLKWSLKDLLLAFCCLAAMILGGGAGQDLWPLTNNRAEPAVPFAGLFRLIDVPLSNCIHSGISNIYVLTQYNATSLNRHLSRAYQFLNNITFTGDDACVQR